MNKHENECTPFEKPQLIWQFNFCPGWLIHFQGDKKGEMAWLEMRGQRQRQSLRNTE